MVDEEATPAPISAASDVLDLVTAVEESKTEAEVIELFGYVSEKVGPSSSDRDTFGSFDGVTALKEAVERTGFSPAAMRAFCLTMPAVCTKNNMNRSIARDVGMLDRIVDALLLETGDGGACGDGGCGDGHFHDPKIVFEGDDDDHPFIEDCDTGEGARGRQELARRENCGEDLASGETERKADAGSALPSSAVLCIAIEALCRSNDPNKKTAARVSTEFNEEEMCCQPENPSVPMFVGRAGAIDGILGLLEISTDERVLIHGFRAMRSITMDDDSRQASCAPAAVENREYCTNEENFTRIRAVLKKAMKAPSRLLAQVVLLLMKDLSWHQNRIHAMVFEDKILPDVISTMEKAGQSEATVYAVLAVLRKFCFSDEMKEMIVFETEALPWCMTSIKKHKKNERIMEQAFGLISNISLRKDKIAELLANKYDLLAVCHTVLHNHPHSPNMLRTVVQCIRNISRVDETREALCESILIEELRDVVLAHKTAPGWRDVIAITRQFLRELREDQGLTELPQYNEYY